jgi:hypothetical protein
MCSISCLKSYKLHRRAHTLFKLYLHSSVCCLSNVKSGFISNQKLSGNKEIRKKEIILQKTLSPQHCSSHKACRSRMTSAKCKHGWNSHVVNGRDIIIISYNVVIFGMS